MKTFQVLIKAFAAVVVEAETPELAMQIACEEVRYGDMEHTEAEVERELTTPEEIASAKRHAQKVVKS